VYVRFLYPESRLRPKIRSRPACPQHCAPENAATLERVLWAQTRGTGKQTAFDHLKDTKMRADDEVHEQVALTFKNLTYSVDLGKKQGTKMILDGISGCFKPSRLTALFGASGCGKTSLMDVLSRRKNTGTIEGEIRFAGAPCKKENIKHLCGYVEQCATS